MKVGCALISSSSVSPAGEAGGRVPRAEVWERALRRLEGIGAGVESERLGEAFFAVDGLRGIHGGSVRGVIAAAAEAIDSPARLAVAPTRFAAFAAARRGPGGEIVEPARLRGFLSPLPVSTLAARLDPPEPSATEMVVTLERLGIRTLGSLAALGRGEMADRFGALGLYTLRLARGDDDPPRPRKPIEDLVVSVELAEEVAGERLDRALRLLVDRLLADPRRGGRTLLALRLGARLSDGGSWSATRALGRPSASAPTLHGALAPRLGELPCPAAALFLRAVHLGPPEGEQLEFGGGQRGRDELAEAIKQVRALAGRDALLKVVEVDSASRVPERRQMLAPFPDR